MAIYKEGQVLESDEARGVKLLQMGFGRQTAKGVSLHLLEAAYLTEKNLLHAMDSHHTLTVKDLLGEENTLAGKSKTKKSSSKSKSTPSSSMPLSDQFLIFRSLRSNGQVVRFSSVPGWWRVLAPGVGRDQERSQTLLQLATPDWKATVASLERQLAVARLMRLELVLAYVQDGRPHLLKISKPPID